MTITVVNATSSTVTIGYTSLAPGDSITLSGTTPEVAAMLRSGVLNEGTVPHLNFLRDPASFPATDRSGSVPLGVTGHGAITGGTGGTTGTFALAFTGGTGSGAAGTFTVAAGAVTTITITASGNYSVAPTAFSFAASSGLSGASSSVTSAPIAFIFASANSSRNGWLFTNTSNGVLYVDDSGATASATASTSKSVAAGQSIGGSGPFSSTAALSVYGATAAKTFTASEW